MSEKIRERGYKIKTQLLKKAGLDVSDKQVLRVCKKYNLLSKIRKRKHPKDYYAKHREMLKETVAENILNRQA